jgi:hypothetical protein
VFIATAFSLAMKSRMKRAKVKPFKRFDLCPAIIVLLGGSNHRTGAKRNLLGNLGGVFDLCDKAFICSSFSQITRVYLGDRA